MNSEDWWVYLLRCDDGSLYCGITRDVYGRCAQHNAGRGSKYVRSRLPAVVVWSQLSGSRSAASKLEYQIKQMRAHHKQTLIQSQGVVVYGDPRA